VRRCAVCLGAGTWTRPRVPGGERQSLGDYPRDWPEEPSARQSDPFVRAQRGVSLADDDDLNAGWL
jgi:hypothetical protein